MTNQFTTSNIMFAGVSLKVIIGHPEHDLLFIAKQVADNAGLCDSSNAVSKFLKLKANKGGLKVNDLSVLVGGKDTIESIIEFPKIQGRSSLFTESQVYDFLLWSRAPKAELLRKWVTEEVLPTIRKTGRYDITESNTAEAKQFSAEFNMLADMMKALGDRMANLETLMQKSVQGTTADLYEGKGRTTVFDYLNLHKEDVKRQGEVIGLGGYVVNKLMPELVTNAESYLLAEWSNCDGRELKTHTAKTSGNTWRVYPIEFIQKALGNLKIRELLQGFNK